MALEQHPLFTALGSKVLARRRFHRWVFTAAGLYNIGWGAYSVLYPNWFFRITEMSPSNHPEIFACLGMVIGLYGILYFKIAHSPESSWLIATVGLTGKVLGPIGAVGLILSNQWPPHAIILILVNDLIWWIPFGVYLFDSWKLHHSLSN